MKDLGPLHYFLGVEVHHFNGVLLLNQRKYAYDLLDRAQMKDYNSISTPMVSKLCNSMSDEPYHDPQFYRSIVGGL